MRSANKSSSTIGGALCSSSKTAWKRFSPAFHYGIIVDHATPGACVLWRSGGLCVDYVDPLRVTVGRRQQRVGDLLTYHHDLAATLHAQDRVHTYGSFYVADVAAT